MDEDVGLESLVQEQQTQTVSTHLACRSLMISKGIQMCVRP